MKPYIGVTGFTSPTEVKSALSVFPVSSTRLLMVGVLVSWKSLRNIPLKPRWQKQFPNPATIAEIFPNDSRVVNLIHFSTEEGQESSILADMLKIHEIAGPNFHGFQLNIPWPEIQVVEEYRKAVGNDYRLVLQIGQKAVEAVGGTPRGVIDMLSHYVGVINNVLLDPSGGLGKPFDTERAREFLSAIAEQRWNLGLGVAGGLGPDSLNLVKPLVVEFPILSIDAQSQLRNGENNLDLNATKIYITKALQMFG